MRIPTHKILVGALGLEAVRRFSDEQHQVPRTHFRTLIAGLALAAVALCACGGAASNRKATRIAVLSIDGSKAAKRTLVKAIDRRYQMVSSKRFKKTARKLDAESEGSKDIRKVARKLDIDAVVTGEFIKKSRKKYQLRLVLRAGDTGREFVSLTIKLKSKKFGKKDARKVREKLYAALGALKSRREAAEREERLRKKEKEKARLLAKKRRSKHKSRRRSKRGHRGERSKVVTVRDDEGQALDDEDPF